MKATGTRPARRNGRGGRERGRGAGLGGRRQGRARRLGVVVDRVNWFSTYHVHHRVADRFRRGRAFLLGDAAHIHSPVGGQGMNTGIGDAVNLAWKLAAVLRGPRRGAAARQLRARADRLRPAAGGDHRPGLHGGHEPRAARAVHPCRGRAARAAGAGADRRAFRRFMFRTVSQTAVHYRAGGLNEGRAGRVRGGDRLPWVAAD